MRAGSGAWRPRTVALSPKVATEGSDGVNPLIAARVADAAFDCFAVCINQQVTAQPSPWFTSEQRVDPFRLTP